MIAPCTGCGCRGCERRAEMMRTALFAWAVELTVECPDYEEPAYHGVRGCRA